MENQDLSKRCSKRLKSKENTGKMKSKGKENTPKRPKLHPMPNPDDAIGMSKQLTLKKTTQLKRTKSSRSSSRSEVKICPNGKLMPSLADLEKMYEDSDEDEQTSEPKAPDAVKSPDNTTSDTKPFDITLPDNVNKIVEKMMDIISNMPTPPELVPDTPPPPIVPPKKKKKSDVPYIVGCKDRPQVIKKPNANFCKGDSDYGVEKNTDPEDEPKDSKRKKKSKIGGFSKSIFNAQSDDIAERLKAQDTDSVGSSDSSKTVEYDFSKSIRNPTFSPLPSTSKDNETFIKNDRLFNESLLSNNTSMNASRDSIDVPCETIVLHHHSGNSSSGETSENPQDRETKQHIPTIITNSPIEIDDDCCIIVESPVTVTNEENKYLVERTYYCPPDDEYSQIEVDHSPIATSENEIIDVDSLIAENAAIIKRMPHTRQFDSVIEVVDTPNTSDVQIIENTGTNQIEVIEIPNNNSDEEIIDISNTSDLHLGNTCRTNVNQQYSSNNNYHDTESESSNSNQVQSNSTSDRQSKKDMIKDIVWTFFSGYIIAIRKLWKDANMRTLMDNIIDYFVNTLDYDVVAEDVEAGDIIEPTLYHFLIKNKTTSMSQANVWRLLNAKLPVHNSRLPNPNGLAAEYYSRRPVDVESPVQYNSAHTDDDDDDNDDVHAQYNLQSPFQSESPVQNNSPQSVDRETPVCESPHPSIDEESTVDLADTSTPKKRKSIGDCPICMDSLSNTDIASTICGHVFCLRCIKTAIQAAGKRCPTCRKTLKGIGYHQLFL